MHLRNSKSVTFEDGKSIRYFLNQSVCRINVPESFRRDGSSRKPSKSVRSMLLTSSSIFDGCC